MCVCVCGKDVLEYVLRTAFVRVWSELDSEPDFVKNGGGCGRAHMRVFNCPTECRPVTIEFASFQQSQNVVAIVF